MKAAVSLTCLALALALGAVAPAAAVDPAPSFGASTRYPVPYARGCGYCTEASASGDLNGDGNADVVVVNADQTVSVFIAKGDGSLRARRDFIPAGDPRGVALVDVNRDGHADVALADLAGFVTVFLNAGDGTLGTRRDYVVGALGSGPASIAAADLDGDGAPDLVAASPNRGGDTGVVSVLHNNGDGTFATSQDYAVGAGNPVSVAAGDLDGDRKPDIVTGDSNDSISVFFNKGDGTFRAPREDAVSGAASVAIGDLNGDGELDVATADGERGVSVLLNAGDGSFRGSHPYPVLSAGPDVGSAEPQSIAIGDLNGDRRPDLATANFDKHLSVLLNGGAGTFRTTFDLGAARCGYFSENDRMLALGDVNGDGRVDLAAAGDKGLCLALGTGRRCNVQEVRGLTVASARVRLARAHCRVGRIRHAHGAYTSKGHVSAQRPGFGAVLRQGARVDLVVSLGRTR